VTREILKVKDLYGLLATFKLIAIVHGVNRMAGWLGERLYLSSEGFEQNPRKVCVQRLHS